MDAVFPELLNQNFWNSPLVVVIVGPNSESSVEILTNKEVVSAIEMLKNNKSLGIDDI